MDTDNGTGAGAGGESSEPARLGTWRGREEPSGRRRKAPRQRQPGSRDQSLCSVPLDVAGLR